MPARLIQQMENGSYGIADYVFPLQLFYFKLVSPADGSGGMMIVACDKDDSRSQVFLCDAPPAELDDNDIYAYALEQCTEQNLFEELRNNRNTIVEFVDPDHGKATFHIGQIATMHHN